MDLNELSAAEASARMSCGELTSEALVVACLERIAEREPEVKAWAWIDAHAAVLQARERDQESRRSPLHGIPVGIKDIIDTGGIPTARGSEIYRDRVPEKDAACVAALRSAGAVVLGKTVTTEFAAAHPGPSRNPWDLAHTPGGSSSGSAAAVADRMVPLALGTQTSGSVIRPGAFCGIFALKPTVGTWPLRGVQPLAPTLDTLGVFARDPQDLALTYPYMGGTVMVPPPTSSADQIRIGFAPTSNWPKLEDDSGARIEEFVEGLEADGFDLPRVDLPEAFADLTEAQLTIYAYEAARELSEDYQLHRSELSEFMQAWLERGRRTPEDDYRRALDVRRQVGLQMAAVWESVDLLLTPAVPGEAPRSLNRTGDPLFCRGWTTLGGPALAVPALAGSHGLPLGLQLTGPPGSEGLLFAAAGRLMNATPCTDRFRRSP